MQDPRQRAALALGALLLVVFLCYVPAVANDFTMDDRHAAMGIVGGLPRLMIYELEPLWEYFSSHYWRGDHEVDDLFRPVTVLSYALRFQICGDNARVAHLVNLLLHLGATVLVYRMLAALAGPTSCLVGAGVFGLHAVHSEVVVGVVGRAELLAFVFGAGAVLYWCRASAAATGRRSPLPVALTSALLFLAFCSKEVAVAWVPFLFVFQLARAWRSEPQGIAWPRIRRFLWDTLLVSVVPLALFLLLRERMLALLPHPVATHNFVRNPLAHMDLVPRFCMGTYVLGHGLGLCLLPLHLAADYGHRVFPLVEAPTQWRFLVAAAALLLILVGGLRVRQRHPLLFLGTAAFLGFAFVTSNIPVVTGTIFGERLYYTPSLGLSFAVAWLWGSLRGRWRVALSVLLATWGVLCAVVILQRNTVWKDDASLFLNEAEEQPLSVRMQLCAASVHFERKEIDQALRHIRRAIELEPEHANAWGLLGAISLERKQYEDAEKELKTSLTARYFDRHIDHANAHANLGHLCFKQDRFAEAAEHFEQALRISPGMMDLFDALKTIARSGGLQGTGKDLETILLQGKQAVPYSPYWDGYLGLLAFEAGRPDAALPLLESAVQRIPRDLYGGAPGVTLQLALADCFLATGQPDRVRPLLSGLVRQQFRPEVALEAAKRIDAAFGR